MTRKTKATLLTACVHLSAIMMAVVMGSMAFFIWQGAVAADIAPVLLVLLVIFGMVLSGMSSLLYHNYFFYSTKVGGPPNFLGRDSSYVRKRIKYYYTAEIEDFIDCLHTDYWIQLSDEKGVNMDALFMDGTSELSPAFHKDNITLTEYVLIYHRYVDYSEWGTWTEIDAKKLDVLVDCIKRSFNPYSYAECKEFYCRIGEDVLPPSLNDFMLWKDTGAL